MTRPCTNHPVSGHWIYDLASKRFDAPAASLPTENQRPREPDDGSTTALYDRDEIQHRRTLSSATTPPPRLTDRQATERAGEPVR